MYSLVYFPVNNKMPIAFRKKGNWRVGAASKARPTALNAEGAA